MLVLDPPVYVPSTALPPTSTLPSSYPFSMLVSDVVGGTGLLAGAMGSSVHFPIQRLPILRTLTTYLNEIAVVELQVVLRAALKIGTKNWYGDSTHGMPRKTTGMLAHHATITNNIQEPIRASSTLLASVRNFIISYIRYESVSRPCSPIHPFLRVLTPHSESP